MGETEGATYTNMKKIYVSPLMVEVNVTAESMLAVSIKIDNEISLIAVVGRKLQSNIGIAGKIFTALGENDINIKMIEQGADEINIIIGVNDRNFKKTIRVLYNLSEVNE